MPLTTPFILDVQLTPLPDGDEEYVAFGVSLLPGVNIKGYAETELKDRFIALKADLGGVKPPADPEDSADWDTIDQAYRAHLSELLCYSWDRASLRFVLTNGTVGLDSTAGELEIVPFDQVLELQSEKTVLRGLQRALYDGFDIGAQDVRLDRAYAIEGGVADLPHDGFLLGPFLAQTSRWPAPIPQTVLRTAFFLRAKRQNVERLRVTNDTLLHVVVGFENVDAVHEPSPQLTPLDDDNYAFVYAQPADARVSLNLRGLRIADVLDTTANDAVFLDVYRSLWLKSPVGEFAHEVADRDWHSRLHGAIETAGDIGLLLLEALRGVRDSATPPTDLKKQAPLWFRAALAALRDTAGPGLIAENAAYYLQGHAPLAAEIVDGSRDDEDLGAYDVFSELESTGDEEDIKQRIAMMHVLRWYVSGDFTLAAWIEQLRASVEPVREILPPDSDLDRIIKSESPAEWVVRLERIYDTVLEPEAHAALIMDQWHAALAAARKAGRSEVHDAEEFLALNEKFVIAHLAKIEIARLARRDAAMSLVADVVRWNETQPLRERLSARLAERERYRFSSTSRLKPRITDIQGINLNELQPELDRARALFADTAMNEILPPTEHRRPDAERQPLLLTLDTLNDDDDQDGKPDVNEFLRGYGSFVRWRHPATGKTGPWSYPMLGHVAILGWRDAIQIRNMNGTALESLGQKEAAAAHRVRDNVLRLDNNRWLHVPSAGIPAQYAANSDEPSTKIQLAVVPAEGAASFESAIPRLGFGLTYDFVPHAATREGGLPGEIAARLPYLWEPRADIGTWLDAQERLDKLYLRTVGVGPLRMEYVRKLNGADTAATPNSGPFDIDRHQPIALRAFDPDESIAAEQRAFVHTPKECVLLDGLPAHAKYDAWRAATVELRAPPCTADVYDAWLELDKNIQSNGDDWRKWQERMAVAEQCRSLVGLLSEEERAADGITPAMMAETLDDPAVEAIYVRWKSWRGGDDDFELVELVPVDSKIPKPADIPDWMTEAEVRVTLLKERARAAYRKVAVTMRIGQKAPGDKALIRDPLDPTRISLRVNPGELGEVELFPTVRDQYFTLHDRLHRLHEVVANTQRETVTDAGGVLWRLFTPERLRVEVATRDEIAPAQLYKHCRPRIAADGSIELWWDRNDVDIDGNPTADGREFSNVASVRAAVQAWRTAGKPLSTFPDSQLDLDELPASLNDVDPTSHAIVWDAEGFAERDDDATTAAPARQVAVMEKLAKIWSERATVPLKTRYMRFRISAQHRYAGLYRVALADPGVLLDVHAEVSHASEPVTAKWRRALRPGRWDTAVAHPAIKIVVPLTQPFESQERGTHASDLLVVLNEEWGTVAGLAESLEVFVDSVERDYSVGGQTVWKTREESSRDVMVSGKPLLAPVGSLAVIGPLGHTFDTDSREPLFVASSFIVQAPAGVEPWTLLKLAVRRVLLPELMEGYYDAPDADATTVDERYQRIALSAMTTPKLVLDATRLDEAGQGCISLQDISFAQGSATITVRVGGTQWAHAVVRGADETWTINHAGNLPDGALPVDWTRPAAGRLSLRYVAKRLKPRGTGTEPKAPRWEVAFYAQHGAERRWERLGHWRLDEPEDFTTGIVVESSAGVAVAHGSAACLQRFSAYVDADWNQVLPDADKVAIDNKPWSGSARTSSLRVRSLGDDIELVDPNGERFKPPYYHETPYERGKESQGLFHLLLVTRMTRTSDDTSSESVVGLFQYDRSAHLFRPDGGGVSFLKPSKIPNAELRASVLLVHADPRWTPRESTSETFWADQMSDGSTGATAPPRLVKDAKLRVLAITSRMLGDGGSEQ